MMEEKNSTNGGNDIVFAFQNLIVWQKSRVLVKDIYRIVETFPRREEFALSNQLRRAVISVASNIAEGNARDSAREQCHFLEISYGSLMEIVCQLQLAVDLGYLPQEVFTEEKRQILQIAKMLSALRTNKQKRG